VLGRLRIGTDRLIVQPASDGNRMDLSLLASIELETIADPGGWAAIRGLLNLVEQLVAENQALRAEHQRLRDEINRLQGQQG